MIDFIKILWQIFKKLLKGFRKTVRMKNTRKMYVYSFRKNIRGYLNLREGEEKQIKRKIIADLKK